MKPAIIALATLACTGSVFAKPVAQPVDQPPLIPIGHEHADGKAARSLKTLQWVGPIAPAGEVYAYYGTIKDVGMQMVKVARDAQVHQVDGNPLQRRKKTGIVCSREDMAIGNYAETWAAYKLAAVLGSLAATNHSAVVTIDGGHGHCVDLTACDEHERARIQLCNDHPKPQSIKVSVIAEYAYAIIYECAKQDGSALIWGQQFDSKDFNVIISACPNNPPHRNPARRHIDGKPDMHELEDEDE